jgi:hypothetical protein
MKRFFFCKKRSKKTFDGCGSWIGIRYWGEAVDGKSPAAPRSKSFLVLFFKKELLS